MEWTRGGLESAGFRGFCRFGDLKQSAVPQEAGVYVVLRESKAPPKFLVTSVAGHFKDRDPTVSLERLKEAWIEGVPVLYIGKAAGGKHDNRGLRRRLDEYRRHGAGERVGHWGGRFIWQLRDSGDLLVAWKATASEDAENVESQLIADFAAAFGHKPFANRKLGKHIAAPDAGV